MGADVKVTELNQPGESSHAKVRGHKSSSVAGTALEDLATSETDTTLVLTPDGDGGVAWGTSGAAAMVPYYIPVDTTFTVPLYRQALFYEPIEVDGALVVNGLLQGVD